MLKSRKGRAAGRARALRALAVALVAAAMCGVAVGGYTEANAAVVTPETDKLKIGYSKSNECFVLSWQTETTGNTDTTGKHFRTVGWYIQATSGSTTTTYYWEMPYKASDSTSFTMTYTDVPLTNFKKGNYGNTSSSDTLNDWLFAHCDGTVTLKAFADVVFHNNTSTNDYTNFTEAKKETHYSEYDKATSKAHDFFQNNKDYFKDGYFGIDVEVSSTYNAWKSTNTNGVSNDEDGMKEVSDYNSTTKSGNQKTVNGKQIQYYPAVSGTSYNTFVDVTINDGYVLKSVSAADKLYTYKDKSTKTRTSLTDYLSGGAFAFLSNGSQPVAYGHCVVKTSACKSGTTTQTEINTSPIYLKLVMHTDNGTQTSAAVAYNDLEQKDGLESSVWGWTGSGHSVTDCISEGMKWYLDEDCKCSAKNLLGSDAKEGNFTVTKGKIWTLYQSLVRTTGTYKTGTKYYWAWDSSSSSYSSDSKSTSDQGGVALSADGLTITLNIYAEKTGYTVNYKSGSKDVNGAKMMGDVNDEDAMSDVSGVTYDSLPVTVAENAYTWDGYTYAGYWLSNNLGTEFKDGSKATTTSWDSNSGKAAAENGSHTMGLKAQWIPNDYVIEYDPNGADAGTVPDQALTCSDAAGGSLTVRQCTYYYTTTDNTYTFMGWSTSPDGGVEFAAGDTIDETAFRAIFKGTGWKKKSTTATLYAVWDKEKPDQLEGKLTYNLYLDGTDLASEDGGTYKASGFTTLYQCMFGTRYGSATTITRTYPTGLLDGFEEKAYVIPAGTSIYEWSDKLGTGEPTLLRFMGWSVDKDATWEDSQGVIWAELKDVDGEDLAYMCYSLANPVKRNSAWDSYDASTGEPPAEPISITLSSDAATRAQQLLDSAAAWEEYLGIPGTDSPKADGGLLVQAWVGAKEQYEYWCDKLAADTATYDEAVEMVAYYDGKVTTQQNKIDKLDKNQPTTSMESYTDEEGNTYYFYDSSGNFLQDEYDEAVAAYESDRESHETKRVKFIDLRDNTWAKKRDNASGDMAEESEQIDLYSDLIASDFKAADALSGDVNSVIKDSGTKLYAIWDAYPDYKGMDELSINVSEKDSVTDSWLKGYAHALDFEEGTPGLTVSWSRSDIDRLTATGYVTVTYTATDSAGNSTRYTTNLWVNWDKQIQSEALSGRAPYETGYTRFISRYFYELGDPDNFGSEEEYDRLYRNATAENHDGEEVPYYMYCGGLNPNSLWYTDADYKAAILEAFDNGDSDDAQETWHFSHEQVEASQEFVSTYGYGDLNGEGNLLKWWNQFAPDCRTEG